MTKKKPRGENDKEQSERFKRTVRDLEAAGELSPTADEDFNRAVDAATKQRLAMR